MKHLLLTLLVATLSFPALALDKSYYACEVDSDCTLVNHYCGGYAAINIDKAEEVKVIFREAGKLKECYTPKQHNPTAICHKKKKKCQVQQDIVGKAIVIDGNTIKIDGKKIRLEGIDAPEHSQKCIPPSASPLAEDWQCGRDSSIYLVGLIDKWDIRCQYSEKDRYGRILGACWRQGTYFNETINEAMVMSGFAVAYRKHSDVYIEAEQKAKAAKRGIWGSEFDMPWDWRKKNSQ